MNDLNDLIRRGCVGVLTCLLVTLLAGANPPAHAAPQSPPPTFTVNSTSDVVASVPLDNGICETAPHNSTCTLRAAIMKANQWPGGGVTISLPALTGGAEYMLTIDTLTITNTMTIIGGGAANTVIDGSGIAPRNSVLTIGPGAIATIGGVTIQGGNASIGGGILVHHGSALTLHDSSVTGNVGTDGGGISILGDGALTIHDSLVTSNTASGDGGGIFSQVGILTVTDSIVSHNTAGFHGGGIVADYGAATTLSRVMISSNTSKYGGGLVNGPSSSLFDIVDSTISDNEATIDGGGIDNDGSSLAVINSTISGNFSDGNGGGIFNGIVLSCCAVSLYNATLVGNLANQALVGGTGGGIFNTSGSTVALQNTLLDANVRSTDAQDVFDACSGTVTSLSYNLFSTTTGCTIPGGTHDIKDVPGQTGPLQDNGGPTFTHALLPGSPAIDAGNPGGCADSLGTTLHTDQRGAPRPANGAGSTRCDIGAFELQRTLVLPLVLK